MKAEEIIIGTKGILEVRLTNHGCKIIDIIVPDKEGRLVDVSLGYKTAQEFVKGEPYLGSILGRVTNRIKGGEITIDEKTFVLGKNEGKNCLHGGLSGFNDKFWDFKKIDINTVLLSYYSVNGEEGFPGNLTISTLFKAEGNSLEIEYKATTDSPTAINISQHTFFNLNGEEDGSVLDHQLMIPSKQYTTFDEGCVPTGEFTNVENTVFDFRTPKIIGERINENIKDLKIPGGYDLNYVFDKPDKQLIEMAEVVSLKTGIKLKVFSTEQGVQFYTGNFLNGSVIGKSGVAYAKNSGFCLEPQNFPNAINISSFPNSILRPREEYFHKIVYEFGISS